MSGHAGWRLLPLAAAAAVLAAALCSCNQAGPLHPKLKEGASAPVSEAMGLAGEHAMIIRRAARVHDAARAALRSAQARQRYIAAQEASAAAPSTADWVVASPAPVTVRAGDPRQIAAA